MQIISLADSIIILLYFLISIGIGLYFSYRKDRTVKEYFFGEKSFGWIVIGLTIFVTNISSEHLIGLAGAGATKGLSVIQFEWLAVIAIIFLGWYVAPIFLKNKILTIPQYFGNKFDHRSRAYVAYISLFIYLITKIGVSLLVCNYLLKSYLEFNVIEATLIIVFLTGLYTVIGGISSIIHTQLFQSAILILGAVSLTYFGLQEVGGFSELSSKLSSDYFVLFKPFDDVDLPWTGIIFGAPILALWYWCSDQYIVQRILYAKGIKEIKKGTLLASFMKTLPILLFVIPGLVVISLNPTVAPNEAFAFLLSGRILPVGIKGIVISGLFAALMSSLSAAFHSSATIFTIDIYKPKNPEASENKLILIGRLTTTAIVVITIALIPLLKMIDTNIYIFLQNLQAFISPPIAAVFLISLFWKNASAKGAFYTLIIGGIIGLTRIFLSFVDVKIELINAIKEVNYLHFASYLFLVSFSIYVFVSYKELQNKLNLEVSNNK